MRAFFGCIVALLFLTACVKENPRAGLYWAEFYTVDTNGFNVTRYDNAVHVSNPTESSISINGATFSKKGDHVSGTLYQTQAFSLTVNGLVIDGTWKRKGGYYKINGDYSAFTTSGDSYGTFRMESY